MRLMTSEERQTAANLFGSSGDNIAQDRLTIRFDTLTHRINKGYGRRTPLHGAVLIHYVEKPAVTPTGGHYMARRLTVRTADGKRWVGQMRNGTDVVRLRPEPKK